MLAAKEFTVGTLADAKPLSLVLPRKPHEGAFLVGRTEQGPAAVCLDGSREYYFFMCSEIENRRGLLIPNVGVEIDETSLFDPQYASAKLGTIVRLDTRLVVCAGHPTAFGDPFGVILESDLPPTHDLSAGFSRWQIVIGEGPDKRVLREIDTGQKIERSF